MNTSTKPNRSFIMSLANSLKNESVNKSEALTLAWKYWRISQLMAKEAVWVTYLKKGETVPVTRLSLPTPKHHNYGAGVDCPARQHRYWENGKGFRSFLWGNYQGHELLTEVKQAA